MTLRDPTGVRSGRLALAKPDGGLLLLQNRRAAPVSAILLFLDLQL